VTNVSSALSTIVPKGLQTFNLGRIGGRARVLTIDQSVTAPGTVQDYADIQLQSAAIGILRRVDREIGQGQFSGSPAGFDGLSQLAPSRVTGSSGDFGADMRLLLSAITPNGSSGTGEAVDCLFGGPLVLRKLMALSQSQGGIGTWARDGRTGRNVFHYMGIPLYRTETDEAQTEIGGVIQRFQGRPEHSSEDVEEHTVASGMNRPDRSRVQQRFERRIVRRFCNPRT
jgi:hypothetical protein